MRRSLETIKWSVFYGGHSIWAEEGSEPATAIAPGVRRVGSGTAISLGHFIAFRGDAIARAHDYLKAQLTRSAWPCRRWSDGCGRSIQLVSKTQSGRGNHSRRPPAWLSARFEVGHLRFARWFERTPVIRDAVSWLRRMKNHVRANAGIQSSPRPPGIGMINITERPMGADNYPASSRSHSCRTSGSSHCAPLFAALPSRPKSRRTCSGFNSESPVRCIFNAFRATRAHVLAILAFSAPDENAARCAR